MSTTETGARERESVPYDRPRPLIEPEAGPYWESLREHAMKVQKCDSCALHFFPPSDYCPGCLEPEPRWVPVSGAGTVWGSVTMNRAYRPAYAEDIPYNVTIVELAEGPKLWTNVVGCDPAEVVVGMAVTVRYDDVAADLTLARFVPDRSADSGGSSDPKPSHNHLEDGR